MLDKSKIYAIVGASENEAKYGFKVFKDLKDAGYNVVPVNLRGGEILGLKVYPTLLEIPKKIDVAVFIVPPSVTEEILKSVKNLKIEKVWLQPGSESKKAVEFCEKNGINCIYNACIMVERRKQ